MKLRIRIITRNFRRDFPKDLVTLRQKRTDLLSLLTVRATEFCSRLPEDPLCSVCVHKHREGESEREPAILLLATCDSY